MSCNCNRPKKHCGIIPTFSCCNSNDVSRQEFYDYKKDVDDKFKDIDLDFENNDLRVKDLELRATRLELEKQGKLVAGDGISLEDNEDHTTTISVTGGTGDVYTKAETDALLNAKQNTLIAGDHITITGDTISADMIDAYTKAETDALLAAKQDKMSLTPTDPGEGVPLGEGQLIGVYEP